MTSWLMNRHQRVVFNGFSTQEEVLSGVPQGGVLSSLRFIIFINDIDKVVTQINIIKKFADVTKLGQQISTDQDKLNMQEALEALCK